MTRWPMMLLTYDWPTPIRPLTMGTMIISPTKMLRRRKFFSGIATSIRSLSRSGLTIPRRLVRTIVNSTTATSNRYGRKNPAIRLIVLARRSFGTGRCFLGAKETHGTVAPATPPAEAHA